MLSFYRGRLIKRDANGWYYADKKCPQTRKLHRNWDPERVVFEDNDKPTGILVKIVWQDDLAQIVEPSTDEKAMVDMAIAEDDSLPFATEGLYVWVDGPEGWRV
jgi:hypothetical protein